MKPSKENPKYTVAFYCSGVKYDFSPVLLGIELDESQNQISQCAKIELINIKIGSRWVSSVINGRDRVYIFADDGEKKEEVFRGYVWKKPYRSELEKTLTVVCYDQLIYWQESDEYCYFPAGKSTKDVVSTICSNWGIPLEYTYNSITHKKLPLRGKLSDLLTSDLLDLVKDRTGVKYVVRSDKDTVKISPVGKNSTVYRIKRQENALKTESELSMDGIVTQVKILGKENEDDRAPVEAVVKGDTGKYGTVQKIIDRDENTTLADAKTEANQILKQEGKPTWVYEADSVDIPWLRKGDKVNIWAGDITFDCIVLSVSRTITTDSKEMHLELERA